MKLHAGPLENETCDRSITVLHAGNTTLIVLAGELDIDAIGHHGIRDLEPVAERPHVIVEASRVAFIDCAFLAVIVALASRCDQRHGSLTIVDASDQVRRLCHLADVDRLLDTTRQRSPQTSRTPDVR